MKKTSAPASMTFQQFLQQGAAHTTAQGAFVYPQHTPAIPHSSNEKSVDITQMPPSAEPAHMQPLSQALSTAFLNGAAAAQPISLLGSDGRIEVHVAPGSLDLTQATVPGGAAPAGSLTLQLIQDQGHFVGPSNQLGTYHLQVVDGQGRLLSGVHLRQAVTILYHYQPWEITALGLDPDHILLSWPDEIAAAQQAKQPTSPFILPLQNNAQTHTLSVQTSVLGAGPLVLSGASVDQSPPKPLLFSVGGNSGQGSYSYPLLVPPGPAGFAPTLDLTYSSDSPNQRHSRTSPAESTGDGWSLSMGSISATVYPNGSASAGTWYSISGVGNVSDRLVPDTVSGYYQTMHISHLRIYQTTVNGQPCFQVWDTSGTYYEFGCTTDSLQYYTNANGRQNYRWDLDKIVAPMSGSVQIPPMMKERLTRHLQAG